MALKFTLHGADKQARLGTLHTKHGDIQTPAFMPVGTAGTVKGVFLEDVKKTGAEIILGNTYHLMLKPGLNVLSKMNGLHNFIKWDKPILTDSGGFQVMSLSGISKISEAGVQFRSHIDGKKLFISPEISISAQNIIGSNITMCFDECVMYPSTREYIIQSNDRSMRWAKRSKEIFEDRDGYGIFGINQGGMYKDIREQSFDSLLEIGFDGYAIGGLAVGEPQDLMIEVLGQAIEFAPKDKPRYLMGVGKPQDILRAVEQGIDMFDCVIPTRNGRNNRAFTTYGEINLKNAKYKYADYPIDSECGCPICKQHSLSYIHHLFRSKEMLGPMLTSLHNLYFYQNLMQNIRLAIKEQRFNSFLKSTMAKLESNKK